MTLFSQAMNHTQNRATGNNLWIICLDKSCKYILYNTFQSNCEQLLLYSLETEDISCFQQILTIIIPALRLLSLLSIWLSKSQSYKEELLLPLSCQVHQLFGAADLCQPYLVILCSWHFVKMKGMAVISGN